MKITLFTSNQPRHIALAKELSKVCDKLYCIQECNTVFPGIRDDFYKKTELMQSYFNSVMKAENLIFGDIQFSRTNVSTLSIKLGDLNKLSQDQLKKALDSDYYIVFGASFIKGWLIDHLVKNKAINIHMGLSPFYRGSSCNFWALYDENPNYVGATIHRLTKGLDSGPMLYHCLPGKDWNNLFEYTMLSVKSAHFSLLKRITDSSINSIKSIAQDRKKEIRYSKNIEFNDQVLENFNLRKEEIESHLKSENFKSIPELLNTFSL